MLSRRAVSRLALSSIGVTLLTCLASPASAADAEPVAHAAFQCGTATGPLAGPRYGADLAFGVGFLESEGSEAPFPFTQSSGWLVGGALVLGPAIYSAVEGGYTSSGLFGYSFTAGPAIRLSPGVAQLGGEGSASFEVFLLRIGVRFVAVADSDVQVTAIVGIGNE